MIITIQRFYIAANIDSRNQGGSWYPARSGTREGAAMAAKEEWLVFYHDGKEICSYTIRGTFAGEKEETIKLLAYEKGIPEQEIVCAIVKR